MRNEQRARQHSLGNEGMTGTWFLQRWGSFRPARCRGGRSGAGRCRCPRCWSAGTRLTTPVRLLKSPSHQEIGDRTVWGSLWTLLAPIKGCNNNNKKKINKRKGTPNTCYWKMLCYKAICIIQQDLVSLIISQICLLISVSRKAISQDFLCISRRRIKRKLKWEEVSRI